ncbi:MAG: hypothetical protein KDE27_12370, partial [Planctomycetes bacterium]|nr:hypothetical protein [Planctomycetota bacterium]
KHVPPATAAPLRSRRATALTAHLPDVAIVLSALARAGADDDETAAVTAFAAAIAALAIPAELTLLPSASSSITALDGSLDRLESVSPLGKRNLLAACMAAAGADGVLLPAETDLLRGLAEYWDCPVPLPPDAARATA